MRSNINAAQVGLTDTVQGELSSSYKEVQRDACGEIQAAELGVDLGMTSVNSEKLYKQGSFAEYSVNILANVVPLYKDINILEYSKYESRLFEFSVQNRSLRNMCRFVTGTLIATLSESIYRDIVLKENADREPIERKVVLISFLGQGTVLGNVISSLLYETHQLDIKHYSIGWSKQCGLDLVALNMIRAQEADDAIFIIVNVHNEMFTAANIRGKISRNFEGFKYYYTALIDYAGDADLCASMQDTLTSFSCINPFNTGLLGDLKIPSRSTDAEYCYNVDCLVSYKDFDYTNEFIRMLLCSVPHNSAYFGSSIVPEGVLGACRSLQSLRKENKIKSLRGVVEGIDNTIIAAVKGDLSAVIFNRCIDGRQAQIADLMFWCIEHDIEIQFEDIDGYICCGIPSVVKLWL